MMRSEIGTNFGELEWKVPILSAFWESGAENSKLITVRGARREQRREGLGCGLRPPRVGEHVMRLDDGGAVIPPRTELAYTENPHRYRT
jgi:hypothetical protein